MLLVTPQLATESPLSESDLMGLLAEPLRQNDMNTIRLGSPRLGTVRKHDGLVLGDGSRCHSARCVNGRTMFTRPVDLKDSDLQNCLAENWGIEASVLQYQPVGFGSHHWLVTTEERSAWFVTVDDLRTWSDSPSEPLGEAFSRLARAFCCAHILEEAGLEFVVGPEPTLDGSSMAHLGSFYSVVVHRYVVGQPAGENGKYTDPNERLAMASHLVTLHAATPRVEGVAVTDDLVLPRRSTLEAALVDLTAPWGTGPYAEPTRRLLSDHAEGISRLLIRYDEWSDAVSTSSEMVITHGEPHAANVLVTDQGLKLVDWEAVRLSPPERDLWDLDPGDGSVLEAYRQRSGRELDPTALACYRLWYDLFEIAGYVSLFRAPHERTADVEESWKNLRHFCQPQARWPGIFGTS